MFLPGTSQGHRSLVGDSPKGSKESDTTEATWHGTVSTEGVCVKDTHHRIILTGNTTLNNLGIHKLRPAV